MSFLHRFLLTKPGKSTYRFLLLLQQIETVLKLEIVYSWLAIVIVASALNGHVVLAKLWQSQTVHVRYLTTVESRPRNFGVPSYG